MTATTTKAMTEKKTNLPADLAGSWGTEASTNEDITIPRLLLMHGQSEFVQEGECKQGDLVRSTTRETLGGKGAPVRVIPFMMWKSWVEEERVEGRFEWRAEDEWTLENTDLPWEFKRNGTDWRRNKAYNFYAIIVDDLGKQTTALPIRLVFKRTSFKAGKAIADEFYQLRNAGMPGAMTMWDIGSNLVKGDYNYHVFTTKKAGETEMEHLAECKKWFDLISADRAKATSRFQDHEVDDTENINETETDF